MVTSCCPDIPCQKFLHLHPRQESLQLPGIHEFCIHAFLPASPEADHFAIISTSLNGLFSYDSSHEIPEMVSSLQTLPKLDQISIEFMGFESPADMTSAEESVIIEDLAQGFKSAHLTRNELTIVLAGIGNEAVNTKLLELLLKVANQVKVKGGRLSLQISPNPRLACTLAFILSTDDQLRGFVAFGG